MLKWINEEHFTYNDYEKTIKAYTYKVCNKYGKLILQEPYPLGSISSNGKIDVSYCFERLSLLRPDYGYFSRDLDKTSILTLPTAFRIIDIARGEIVKHISFERLRDDLKINLRWIK